MQTAAEKNLRCMLHKSKETEKNSCYVEKWWEIIQRNSLKIVTSNIKK